MLTELAFTQAYRKYAPALAGAARRLTNGSADSEDIAQDAWAEAWKARDRIDATGLWAWLRMVMRRVWWYRLNKRSNHKVTPMPDFTAFGPEHDSPIDGGQEKAAQVAQIERAASELGVGGERAVCYALAGFDTAETARAAGISGQAVRDAMKKAVAALRLKWRIE